MFDSWKPPNPFGLPGPEPRPYVPPNNIGHNQPPGINPFPENALPPMAEGTNCNGDHNAGSGDLHEPPDPSRPANAELLGLPAAFGLLLRSDLLPELFW